MAIAAFLLGSAGVGCSAPPKHVILIVVDTLRADFGGAATPTLTALAREGTTLTGSASFHQTSLSMGALWTGLTPSIETADPLQPLPWIGANWCGLARFGTGETGSECLPRRFSTLAERLRAAGYRTIGIASNNLLFRPAGFDRGFDDWREVGDAGRHDPREIRAAFGRRVKALRAADRVRAAMLEAVDRAPAGRLFLYVHLMDVHDWYILGDPNLPLDATEHYTEEVARTDGEIGIILDDLRRRHLLDDALVIVTADHGEALDEPHPIAPGKTHFANPSYEPVLRIPLIIWPRQSSTEGLGRTEDLHRWLLRRVGIAEGPPPSALAPNELFITEQGYQTLRVDRWKLMRERASGRTLLFDLETDAGETRNLTEHEPAVLAELDARRSALAKSLASASQVQPSIAPEDADRLRALGYLH